MPIPSPLITITGQSTPLKSRLEIALQTALHPREIYIDDELEHPTKSYLTTTTTSSLVKRRQYTSKLFGRFTISNVVVDCREQSIDYGTWVRVIGGCDILIFVLDVSEDGGERGWKALEGLGRRFGVKGWGGDVQGGGGELEVWVVGGNAKEVVKRWGERGGRLVSVGEEGVVEELSGILERVGRWGARDLVGDVVRWGGLESAVVFDRECGLYVRVGIRNGGQGIIKDFAAAVIALGKVWEEGRDGFDEDLWGVVQLGEGLQLVLYDLGEDLVLVCELESVCLKERLEVLKIHAQALAKALTANAEQQTYDQY